MRIVLNAIDKGERLEYLATSRIEPDGQLNLLKGVYNRIVSDYFKQPFGFELTTYVDAPPGSGLGSSSTLVVAVIGAFVEYLKLPLGDYDIAHLAWQVERVDLGLSGGKQDQYAATFGGFNFMEFSVNDKVIVNPLRVKQHHISELEYCLLLYSTNVSRFSSQIISAQDRNIKDKNQVGMLAMHNLKRQAFTLKEAMLKGELHSFGKELDIGWQEKKKTALEVTTKHLDEIYSSALDAGAMGGKVSGAGGGGFIIFYCPGISRYKVIERLNRFGGEYRRFTFTEHGLLTWTTEEC